MYTLMMKALTNNTSPALKALLRDTKDYPVLSHEEEAVLAAKMKEGDDKARDTLILSNIRFVVHTAYQYAKNTPELPIEDIVSRGIGGLTTAVDKWESEKGKLTVFSKWFIRREIFRSINDLGRTIRQPVTVYEDKKKIENIEEAFINKHGYEPSDDELSEATGLRVGRIRDMRSAGLVTASINQEDDDGRAIEGDWLSDDDAKSPLETASDAEDWNLVISLIQKFPEKEREVLTRAYGLEGEPETLTSIGEDLGFGLERIRQIRNVALRKLQKRVKNY